MYSDFETLVAGVKPCPFCGGKEITTPKKDWYKDNDLRILMFKCLGCECRVLGRLSDDYEGAFESALEAWNRRA